MKLIFLFLGLVALSICSGQKPVYRWDFSGNTPLQDEISGKKINLDVKGCNFELQKESETFYLQGDKAGCLLLLGVFNKSFSKEFSFEINFKGKEFYFTSYPQPYLRLILQYHYIQFSTAILKNGKVLYDNWIIQLNGKNGINYFELADGHPHHIVFRANSATGEKQIVIDGNEYSALKKIGDIGPSFLFTGSDGFKTVSAISRVAVYNSFITDESIIKNFHSAKITVPGSTAPKTKITKMDNKEPVMNPFDFAPGYPNYNVSLLNQLKEFPLPRYPRSKKLLRNFSWLDIMYLHREIPVGMKGFGKQSPTTAVAISEEMTSVWNYYLDLPCLRTDSVLAAKAYSDPSSVPHSLIKFANDHAE
ncbi:MAG TPA: hypothetical protein VLC28_12975, partial [Flavitalea sp.]|nr:hypothetical protein [Flavitalea sp.]